MSNDKFKLEMKAVSNEQCNEWADFLRAKMTLYSVDNLKTSIDTEAVAFTTRTFESLLRIPVADQVIAHPRGDCIIDCILFWVFVECIALFLLFLVYTNCFIH
jgi:hypothetical protein